MNLYGRLFLLILKSLFYRGTLRLEKPVITKFRVHLHDLDLNFHMNNGRYLTLMDLGRFDFLVENGIFLACMKRGWLPVLGETQMVYFKALGLFQSFEIHSYLESYDDKWFVLRQEFRRNNQLMAEGLIRGLFRDSKGNKVSPQKILELGLEPTTNKTEVQIPVMRPSTQAWLSLVDSLRKSYRS